MKMTMRWYGTKFDSVTLQNIRQVPGIAGVITTLYDIPAGELWPLERIKAIKKEVEDADLQICGIESVNIHDDIKIGLPSRDGYIDAYIKTLEHLGQCGIDMVCYNFMPVFDWTRTDLAKKRADGSTVLAYDQKVVDSIDPEKFIEGTDKSSNGFIMPGWEPERLAHVKELFEKYKDVDNEKLFNNLVYFLKAIRPVCEKYDIKMAIHPDDPVWPVFNLPRIITGKEAILKMLHAVDAPFNGLTFCTGSLGTNPQNDLLGIVRACKDRIHFAHVRNLHHYAPGVFEEAAHLSSDGSFDMYEIVRALYETGFSGPIRPDHGRMIWGEKAMPGYGLYDRALGVAYINGLWEAIEKMKLTERGIADTHAWKGYALPKFDRVKMIAATKKNPAWIHFGAGNIFRAFQALLAQELLEKNLTDTGIIVAEGFDLDIIDKAYRPYDNLSLLVTLKSDGSITKTVAASVAESYKCDPSFPDDWNALAEIFRSKSLALVTFTITEKGYAVKNSDGNFLPAYCADFEAGPDKAKMFLSRLCALLYGRYLHADKHPVALVSTDNCSHNGEKLQAAVRAIAGEWQKRGFVDEGFIDYISLPESVSFPWSMIDKITPRPDAGVQAQLKADGFEDAEIIVTDKHTYTASFVNAESPQYLVIEDAFPNGRPPLEKAGVYFTTRDTVNKVERMKVCTCLNPLHTALAIYGCLLGYTLIADEMKDAELNTLVHRIGYDEGLPVVTDPKIIDPKKFIDEVVTVRIPNPFMPDTPQRIACDTSQKLSIRFGETIKAYAADPALGTQKLKYIPLVLAGWCRYLMALDDEGKKFELSPDPLLGRVCPFVEKIELGRTYTAEALDGFLHGLLSDASLFGVDLYAAGLAPLVLEYFGELTAGKGAVRAALKKHIR